MTRNTAEFKPSNGKRLRPQSRRTRTANSRSSKLSVSVAERKNEWLSKLKRKPVVSREKSAKSKGVKKSMNARLLAKLRENQRNSKMSMKMKKRKVHLLKKERLRQLLIRKMLLKKLKHQLLIKKKEKPKQQM